MPSDSLYRRILGPRFDALPEVLRQFHDAPAGGRAHGNLRVERGAGWLRGTMASIMKLPRAASAAAVGLHVVVEGDRERWIRTFEGRRLETVQWARGELLLERFGAIVFSSALVIDGPCLHYKFRRAWWLGIPLARWFAPRVESYVAGGEGGWRLSVRIFAPLVGELVRYEGWIEPE